MILVSHSQTFDNLEKVYPRFKLILAKNHPLRQERSLTDMKSGKTEFVSVMCLLASDLSVMPDITIKMLRGKKEIYHISDDFNQIQHKLAEKGVLEFLYIQK